MPRKGQIFLRVLWLSLTRFKGYQSILTTLGLAITCLVPGTLAFALDVTYQISNYGSKHASIVLSGVSGNALTTNMRSDGLSLRISGVNAKFIASNETIAGSLIETVQQVRRGAFTDLVINLSDPVELSVTPGPSNLKIFLKQRKADSQKLNNIQGSKPDAQNIKAARLPFKIIAKSHKDTKLGEPGTIIILPEDTGITGTVGLSTELKRLAYSLDLIWSWLAGNPMAAPISQGVCTKPSGNDEVIELEKLVKDLTQELVELRKEKFEKH